MSNKSGTINLVYHLPLLSRILRLGRKMAELTTKCRQLKTDGTNVNI